MKNKIVLIDGLSILNRAFFGLPDLTNSEGLHTNAVYGFLNIMLRILEEEKPQHLAVAFDVSKPTFRHEMYQEYKGTRKGMADELRQQVPIMKEMLHAMGVCVFEQSGYEADDILGTVADLAEKNGLAVSIISGDRDLLQLATDTIQIRIPKTKKGGTEIENYYAADVLERYQVTPKQFIDVKALMGDSSDNIPGIPGVGEKTATKIIAEYDNIENAYAHVDEIKPNKAQESLREHYETAQLSKVLATIITDAPVEVDFEQTKMGNLFTKEAYLLCRRLEFKNLLKRFEHTEIITDEVVQTTDGVGIVTDYTKITTAEEMKAYLEKVQEECIGLCVCGTRTYGNAPMMQMELFAQPSQSVFGYAVASAKGNAIVNINAQDNLRFIQQLCKNAEKVMSFDVKKLLKFMDAEDIPGYMEGGHFKDIAVGAYLLNPLKNAYPYDEIASEYCGCMVKTAEELLGKTNLEEGFARREEGAYLCAITEAEVALKSWDSIYASLQEQEMAELYDTMEMPLVYVLDEMEQNGIRLSAQDLKEYSERLAVGIEERMNSIYEQAGEEFNINSPKQLGVILFEKLQLPYGKKTKTGYSTAAEVLEKLAPEYPIVSEILEYRQLTKLKSTYADGLANYIQGDGRIHGNFNQTITATGRISSTEPNLQNIPIRMELGRQIRKVFLPKEGYRFVDADYSQIELRLLAHMSGDENLIEAYRSDKDIHRITASQVFNIPFEEVTEQERRNAKAVNFGIVYGISSFGLSQDLSISVKEAANYMENYFRTYPGIKTYLDGLVETAKQKGYAETLYQRRRPMPELNSGNFMQRSFGERVAMNAPLQGSAADIMKLAMIGVYKRLKKENCESKLLVQVHDELLIEAKENEVDLVKRILKEEMTGAAQLQVALEVDVHTGENWYEAK